MRAPNPLPMLFISRRRKIQFLLFVKRLALEATDQEDVGRPLLQSVPCLVSFVPKLSSDRFTRHISLQHNGVCPIFSFPFSGMLWERRCCSKHRPSYDFTLADSGKLLAAFQFIFLMRLLGLWFPLPFFWSSLYEFEYPPFRSSYVMMDPTETYTFFQVCLLFPLV